MLYIAIIVSMFVGYLIADLQGSKLILKYLRKRTAKLFKPSLRVEDSRYYGALTKLLNDQADEGLDQFISSMAVNADTLEMHLALGALLRRRGEFDRAVRVHENLLTRPGLPSNTIHHVQLELARDYWRSGLLDRAENLLKELTNTLGVNKGTRWQAAAYLVEIYQDLGDWLQAIDIADQLTSQKFSNEPDFWRQLQAHFCCELADRAVADDEDFAMQKIRSALSYDPDSARAHLLRADYALANDDKLSALADLEHIVQYDSSYLSELLHRYEKCLDDRSLFDRLNVLLKEYPSVLVLAEMLKVLNRHDDVDSALNLVNSTLEHIPALEHEAALIRIAISNPTTIDGSIDAICELLQSKLQYQCLKCGSEHDQMQWLCPSCHSWGTVRLTPQILRSDGSH